MANLIFKFNKDAAQALKSCGADHSVYAASSKFILEETCIPFKPEIKNCKNTMYSAAKQSDAFYKILEKPIKGHPLIVLSSYPTDSRAKVLAANLMWQAICQYREMGPRQRRGKSQPMWHRLYSGFKDPLIDNGAKPSFLVISNVTEESTPHKMEKLRDILEKHSDIPRVVVLGSKTDPVTFIAERLYLSIKDAAFVGGHTVVRSILDD